MKLTGKGYINIKGKRVRSKEGSTMRYGGVTREGQTGDTGVAGFIESTAIPEVELVLHHAGDVSLQELQDMTNETITFDTDTGKSFIFSEAWCVGGLELSRNELKVKFQAMSCKEV